MFSPETSQKLRHLPVRKDRPRRSGCLVAPPKQSHTAPFPQRFQRLKVPGQGNNELVGGNLLETIVFTQKKGASGEFSPRIKWKARVEH